MFNVQDFINDLTVNQDDIELTQAKEVADLMSLLCDDAWLARQYFFGASGSMERQIEFLGGTLLPNAEAQITRLSSQGIGGVSYTQDSWFGTTNADDQHINDEVNPDQLIDDKQMFAEQLRTRMRTAAIILVVNVREHDDISDMLGQHKYGTIKAMAAAKRSTRVA